MQQVNRRDPAPSRAKYRLQRLWLTPTFRFALRAGIPVILSAGVFGFYLSDQDRRDAIVLGLKDAKHAVDAYIRKNPSAQQPRSSGGGLVIIVAIVLLGYALYKSLA